MQDYSIVTFVFMMSVVMPLNRLTPRKGYSVQENVAYGLRARHRLDLFHTQTPREHRPLIVFVHGGAWMHGDKKRLSFYWRSLCQKKALMWR